MMNPSTTSLKSRKFRVSIALFSASVISLGSVQLAYAGTVVASNNRGITTGQSLKSTLARTADSSVDICSSRNVAENLRYFFQCVQSRLQNYTTTVNGAITWDTSKVWSVQNGSIQTTKLPVMQTNATLLSRWRTLYDNYDRLRREKTSLVEQMEALDDSDQADEELEAIERQLQNIDAQLLSVQNSWAALFTNTKVSSPPTTKWPIVPDPTSPYFLTTTTSTSSVYMISENFYADVRALLDKNPNMHLQLLKYYLVATPALFNSMTKPQTYIARANKMFRISLYCADPTSVEGALLSIAVGAAPPLPYPALQACQFTAQRVGPQSDGSAINNGANGSNTAVYSSGVTTAFF